MKSFTVRGTRTGKLDCMTLTRPRGTVNRDYAGPVDGMMIFVLVDAHSKWIASYPTASPTAEATIERLRMAFAEHGGCGLQYPDEVKQLTSWLTGGAVSYLPFSVAVA